MADLGSLVLLLALAVVLYGLVASALGGARQNLPLIRSGRNAAFATSGLLVIAALTLIYSFVTRDFSVAYVAEHSSREMSIPLTIASFYSGQEGSLLYWATTLAIYIGIVAFQNRRQNLALMPYVTAILLTIEAFFLLMLNFVSNPFTRLAFTAPNGLGLNPLLEDPGMLVHPPVLLAGYMTWSVPFAFAMAALITRQLGNEWIRTTRKYALTAWAILGAGNLLGMWWAYHVLGWGGYWGWDPVENAALMPWLVGTAYVHSVMIQERRGMLKVWNLALLIIAFNLSIFGTFIVRSGVLSSVHSFAESSLGPYFFAFLALSLVFSLGWLFYRMPELRAENEFESALSREASFLLNNLILLGIVFATFWGSIFPLVTEALQGAKITVGPPYFQKVDGPLFLVLIALMGIGPLMPWRRASPAMLKRNFALPALLAAIATVILLIGGVRQPAADLALFLCTFVLATSIQEFVWGTRVRMRAGQNALAALTNLVRSNRRRYGGYVVHIGMILIAVAITGSQFYQIQQNVTLKPGQATTIGRYQLQLENTQEAAYPGYRRVWSDLAVTQDGHSIGTIEPGRQYHINFELEPNTKVALVSSPLDDLYVVLAGWQTDGSASFFIFVNPMVMWLWIGGIVLLLGGLITLWPERAPSRVLSVRPARGGTRVAAH
ncbi:MAG TPA: heme lyase CcmF/NrfE family subunit [Chloroflexota bacterium]|nr:heme lyase CcmF/NrfE family subunit [Chloroflexota bacterium]